MKGCWFLLAACTACSLILVHCEEQVEVLVQGTSNLGSVFGFKPCLDESCEYQDDLASEPKPDYEPGVSESVYDEENPRMHCILMRPSAVNTFGEIETMHPGISSVKYTVLEDLIDLMYPFATLQLEDCSPEMKLVDLVILAANALKTQYSLEGAKNCSYRSSDDGLEPVQPTEAPYHPSSGYVTDEPYHPSSETPGYPTEAPYHPSSGYVTEEPYHPSSETSGYITEAPYHPSSGYITEEPYHPSSESPKYVTKEPYHPSSETSEYVTGAPHPSSESSEYATEEPYHPSSESSGYVTEESKLPCSTETPETSSASTSETPCTNEQGMSEEPCQVKVKKPCTVEEHGHEVYPPFVGSLRGTPGIHYPNYTEIPITTFSCRDKKYIPGFYADLETGCQVFHVCYEHRRESFLCPLGTTFNQPILACDYWYNFNCSQTANYYEVNEETEVIKEDKIDLEVKDLVSIISDEIDVTDHRKPSVSKESILDTIAPFLPVKAVVIERQPEKEPEKLVKEQKPEYVEGVASEIFDKIITATSEVVSNTKDVIETIPEPSVRKPAPMIPVILPVKGKPMKMEDLLGKIVVPLKSKLTAVPVAKAAAVKVAVPVAVKASIPVAKVAAKAKVAIPLVAAKAKLAKASVVPIMATKMAVAAPAAKATVVKAALPLVAKTKIAVPVAKGAVAAKIAIPVKGVAVAAKAKVAIPIAKGAAVAGKVVAPKVFVKAAVPAMKAKMVASAVPLSKVKVAPVLKAKLVKSAGAPLFKAKVLSLPLAKGKLAGSIPLVKAKLAKKAAISPSTKAALTLGYMKLLKAKKFALMG